MQIPALKSICFVCAFTLSTRVSAQIVSFNHITQAQGLRNGNVRAILKDYQGFVWIGTEDGLHRYDGYSMKIYRKDENDSTTISSNFILCLFEDSNKNLWIGTLDGSLCYYDRRMDTFIRLGKNLSRKNPLINEAIRVLYENDRKELFIGSGQLLRGVITAQPESIQFKEVELPVRPSNPAGIRVMDIKKYTDSQLLVSFNNLGLFLFDPVTNKFEEHPVSQIEKNIQCILLDKKRNLLWLGTWKNGLLVSSYGGERHRYIGNGEDHYTLRDNYVPAMTEDAQGNVWIATDHGLSRIPFSGDTTYTPRVETLLPVQENHSAIQGSIIKSVYVDPDDNLWVGTYYEGLNVFDKHATHFGSLVPSGRNETTAFKSVNALEDSGNQLWFGTDGNGLYFSGDSIGTSAPAVEKITSCKGIEKIKCLKLLNGKLWIGTWGDGLLSLDVQTRVCTSFDSFKAGVDIGNEILSLETDHGGDLLIGTFDRGFFRFNPKTNKAAHVEGKRKQSNFIDRVNVIRRGADQSLWIGKEAGGLNRTTHGGDQYEVVELKDISATTTVTSIYVDREGILWIGCPSKGLVRYDPQNKTSVLYTEQEGLANSMIHGIMEDHMGRLWISTDAGISVFSKQNKTFVNFGLANGNLSNQFNRSSIMSTPNGYILFGNIKGVSFIKPETFLEREHHGPIMFTRLLVNNKEQLVGKPASVLQENLSVVNEIDLRHDQNSFLFEVASLDYSFSNATEYYYKLTGFNDTWQSAHTQRMIQYTNLPPDEYVLQVRTSPPSSGDNATIASMKITIHPAWWQTFAFKISLAMGLAIAAGGAHRIRIRYLLAQEKSLKHQVGQRTQHLNAANDLLEIKLNEINTINEVLSQQQTEIIEKNNEIQTQNEELTSQNEQIALQHSQLVEAQNKLKEINSQLEKTIDERTHTLQDTITELNKTVFELDRFVYSASHDLSAPLKSILGLVQITHFEADPIKVIAYIDLIKDMVLKLDAVIRNMADYALNSHVKIAIEKFDLHELVEEIFFEHSVLPNASQLTFENGVPKTFKIQNDRMRVKIILNNLVGNGMKYKDNYKEASFIRVDARQRDGDEITNITVLDNGIGIRADLLDKIFNMYFRATETSKGSGLGLFIVKEVLAKIGGKVSVESTLGKGTSFSIHIPEVAEIR